MSVSAAGFGAWMVSEGFVDKAMIPTKGDVPTIGYGSTRYEDGRPVKLGDTITRQRATDLARNLMNAEVRRFVASLPGAKLYPDEFDLYMDFVGQYGMPTWQASTMRREILAGNYVAACNALLRYRFAAGYDCSTPGNKRCWGVWERQLKRHKQCMAVQQ
ncbi:MAG: glycoside hydrolase family protein [Ramlibacter sp.]|nr:glycoside hydrolase family protein [Ramlibacter sp.]